jgi:hypothetical protein
MLLLRVSILDLCWLWRLLWFLLHVVYHKMHRYETLTKVQFMGCNMLHDHEHLSHINPYKLFY